MIWSSGAYYIDPKHLVFIIAVPTDKSKRELKLNNSFTASMKALLETYNWPLRARASVIFDIESQETVDREHNGNWWYHYK